MLRGTQVLLLDEATSALDETTEQQMLENLMHSGRVQTCVLITHRTATAERCDRRYVLHGHAPVRAERAVTEMGKIGKCWRGNRGGYL